MARKNDGLWLQLLSATGCELLTQRQRTLRSKEQPVRSNSFGYVLGPSYYQGPMEEDG